MFIIQKLRNFANARGFDFGRVGKKRLGLAHKPDLLALVEPKGAIFDVGANTGRAARFFEDLFPLAEIWSFEPCEETFKTLNDSPDLKKIRKFNYAFGASDGVALLNKFQGSELNSLLPREAGADRFIDSFSIEEKGCEGVKIRRLDSFIEDHGIMNLSLLKIDTQGYELEVLKGSSTLLEEGRIRVIQLEVNFCPLYQNQPTFSEILDYLGKFGYGLVGLYDFRRDDKGRIQWCDAIFCI